MRGSAVVLRATAWPAMLCLTLCAAVVGGCSVAVQSASGLVTVAVGLLGAAGAFALDEPAAAIAEVTPLSRRRVLAARGLSLALPWSVGCGIAALVGGSALAHGLPLLGAPALGFTLAHLARRRLDEPGGVVAVLLVVGVIVLPMTAAVRDHVQLVPGAGRSGGLDVEATWTIVLGCCAAVLATTARRS